MGKVNISILEQDLKPSFLDEEEEEESDNEVYEENIDEEEVGTLYATEPVNVVYEENVEEGVVLDATEPEPVFNKQDKPEDYKPNQPVKVGKMNYDVFCSLNNK